MLQHASFHTRCLSKNTLLWRVSLQTGKQRPRFVRRPLNHRLQLYSQSGSSYQPNAGQNIKKQTVTVPISDEDTVYALSTAPGKAALAIVRISGLSCLQVYRSLCPTKAIPKSRNASLRTLHEPGAPSNILDSDAIVVYFPGPNSATGEDVLELHIHGGQATVKAVLSAIPGAASDTRIRYAEPGEFTRRAFQNNRLDLAQVEALGDTLSAETEQQRRAAVRGTSGNLGRTYEKWRQQLLYARGELEALIDFSEDQHFDESPTELLRSVTSQVNTILSSIAQHEAASHRGELLKKGIRISLLGSPNAGKSSLLNHIVGREASIVSQEAGTTRDIVEVSLDIRGYLCTFADTAGLRGAAKNSKAGVVIGAIEQEGIRRAKARARDSDIVIALASIERSTGHEKWMIRCDEEALGIAFEAPQYMIVLNKTDTAGSDVLSQLLSDFTRHVAEKYRREIEVIPISCREAVSNTTSEDPGNIHRLTNHLIGLFHDMTDMPTDLRDLLGVTERQRQLLSSCADNLLQFVDEACSSHAAREPDIVVAAEHLRMAADSLARVTGRGEAGDVEEVLGVVFEKFCVGK